MIQPTTDPKNAYVQFARLTEKLLGADPHPRVCHVAPLITAGGTHAALEIKFLELARQGITAPAQFFRRILFSAAAVLERRLDENTFEACAQLFQ